MKILPLFLIYVLLMTLSAKSYGQLKICVYNATVRIEDGRLFFIPGNYPAAADSLDKLLNSGKADTASLFQRALLYDLSNNVLTKPAPGDKGAYEHLLKAEDLVKKAVELKMQALPLKILRAQIYSDLTYRFADDQTWKFKREDIVRRRALFNSFKALANKYYEELSQLDRANASDYRKKLVKTNYPITD